MEQKIYDKTKLNVSAFINQFLGKHLELEFTQCFRLSAAMARKLGRIWHKKIIGVNTDCIVEAMSMEQVADFLSTQKPQDILCLGKQHDGGDRAKTQNALEHKYPERFNKKTIYSSIYDNDQRATRPTNETAIFTTFDSSKGLERKICVICDFTESYWQARISQPQQSYEILRNIFCVAASRGKSRIIFVKGDESLLSEETLSTRVDGNHKLADEVDISSMFDFKYREDIETCFSLLQIAPIVTEDHNEIEVKRADGMIDLSPCVGIYQEAMFFDSYEIDKAIELYISIHPNKTALWNENVKALNLEQKILFLISLETNQDRYRTQVELPFVNENSAQKIKERLSTRFQPNENSQVECFIPFSDTENGDSFFFAKGFADVVKNGIVYELKFVSELTHEHYLQCACYIVALGLSKGVLWNTRDNTAYEITVPDKKVFLDAVITTITKGKITSYYEPFIFNTMLLGNSTTDRNQETTQKPIMEKRKEEYENGYEDVKNLFTQQNRIIRDRYDKRWVKCEKCGTIKRQEEFVSYGGRKHVNLGLCKDCDVKK